MLPNTCRMAFKEWAVVVQALGSGEQILLLRKGGISEVGKHFRVAHDRFLLYPTLEHQKEELLKPAHQERLARLLAEGQEAGAITFSCLAEVAQVFELSEEEQLHSLSAHHIWSDDYAHSRLRWKPRHPLSAMLLRVYRLESPRTVPYKPHFGGCRSWVDLEEEVELGSLTPVLDDSQFAAQVRAIQDALNAAASPVA